MNPLGVAIVLATATTLTVAAVIYGVTAPPTSGAQLIAAPALLTLAALLLHRLARTARRHQP